MNWLGRTREAKRNLCLAIAREYQNRCYAMLTNADRAPHHIMDAFSDDEDRAELKKYGLSTILLAALAQRAWSERARDYALNAIKYDLLAESWRLHFTKQSRLELTLSGQEMMQGHVPEYRSGPEKESDL